MTDIEEILLVLTDGKSSHRQPMLKHTFSRRGWMSKRFNAATFVFSCDEQGILRGDFCRRRARPDYF